MDSLDWFSPFGDGAFAALQQIHALNRALKPGSRVLLRSAGRTPWYLHLFEKAGFTARRIMRRDGFMDMVNMYASCWLLVKSKELPEKEELERDLREIGV